MWDELVFWTSWKPRSGVLFVVLLFKAYFNAYIVCNSWNHSCIPPPTCHPLKLSPPCRLKWCSENLGGTRDVVQYSKIRRGRGTESGGVTPVEQDVSDSKLVWEKIIHDSKVAKFRLPYFRLSVSFSFSSFLMMKTSDRWSTKIVRMRVTNRITSHL